MKIFWNMLFISLITFNAKATELNTTKLNLTPEQNEQILQLKEELKAKVQPMWEEIESNKQQILALEKSYFEKFWNTLTEEQKQKFAKINQ